MFKKLISITLSASLFLFSFVGVASAESKNALIINPESFKLKSADDIIKVEKEESIVELEPIKPRGLMNEKGSLEKRVEKGKLRGKIKNEKADGKYLKDTIIPVRVVLNYDTGVEGKFEKELNEQFGKAIKYEKNKSRKYDLNVTREQLDILEGMDEVLLICEPSDENEVFITGFKTDGEVSTDLNAASEMQGVKKARTDFGVTGDLDGDETDYTSDDVVIAVVDTGIDTSHVDLDGGKVIGWFDAVDGEVAPYDDVGHGTHVSSIAAGTGDGDPGIQTGFAPGAALVGVKVLGPTGGSLLDLEDGLEWLFNNIDNFSIDVVNISLGTHEDLADCQDIIDLINDIKDEGVPVFVAAGNEGNGFDGNTFLGRYYDTLSTFAENTSMSIGSIKDPYEGGWGLSAFSSRGTGSDGPYIVAPGENIRAAEAGTTNEYVTWNGTSMATPIVVGTYALMYDAAYTAGGGTISFSATDMGEAGTDKNYGNGRLLSYESIKNAGGLSGSFNTYRTYIVDQSGSVAQGSIVLYPIQCNSSDADLNITLMITDEDMEDLDLVIWEPGADPYAGDPSTYYINDEDDLPQESFSISSPEVGLYYICAWGRNDAANYTLEITGHEIAPQ